MQHPKVKAGLVQAAPVLFDRKKSTERTITWLEKAADKNCELVLFPESFIPCYPGGLRFDACVGKRTDRSRKDWLLYWENSISVDCPEVKQIGEAVKKANAFVALGVTERDSIGGSLYCSIFFFSPAGDLVGVHRKLKPTGLERYVWAEGNGDSLFTFRSEEAIIGGLICWENYMPEARMAMYQKGVQIYLAPTADSRDSWQSTMRHIALEGRCFVLGCNQFVKKSDYPDRFQEELKDEPDIMSSGGSVIYSPGGELLAGPLWNENGLLTAELHLTELAESKLDFDVIGHYSRKDVFDFQVKDMPETMEVKRRKK